MKIRDPPGEISSFSKVRLVVASPTNEPLFTDFWSEVRGLGRNLITSFDVAASKKIALQILPRGRKR
jgi:hypothetical protein